MLTGLITVLIPVLFWVAEIFAVIAIELGFVGYSRAQRDQATKATMALWGIIMGAIAMVLSVVGLLIMTGVFADRSGEPSAQTENTAAAATAQTSAPTEPEEATPIEAENIYLADFEVGNCVAESLVAETFSDQTVPCSEPHSHEVFAAVDLPKVDGEFPGYPAIDAQAKQLCIAQFAGFVGLAYEQSELKTRFITPSEEGLLAGIRTVHCKVYDPTGEVSGSLRGAKR